MVFVDISTYLHLKKGQNIQQKLLAKIGAENLCVYAKKGRNFFTRKTKTKSLQNFQQKSKLFHTN